MKTLPAFLAVIILSGCESGPVITLPDEKDYKTMPEITQSVTPTQQRAIMTGERPDWSERTISVPVKHY
ncbi:hypothetical protein [Kosakonia oryziphila]|uniref:hypothetical protein n=1 Tax=Kosakonia oryziphila TaxID=1005667 RepID=UPI001112531C|nr:hypothetical protein [Kosakonia oryziphila]